MVVKKIVGLQRNYFWGRVVRWGKICLVKRRKVCQPKSKGGLGVRDIKLVNLSLLVKCRWRLLQEEPFLWKKILKDKYGERVR